MHNAIHNHTLTCVISVTKQLKKISSHFIPIIIDRFSLLISSNNFTVKRKHHQTLIHINRSVAHGVSASIQTNIQQLRANTDVDV